MAHDIARATGPADAASAIDPLSYAQPRPSHLALLRPILWTLLVSGTVTAWAGLLPYVQMLAETIGIGVGPILYNPLGWALTLAAQSVCAAAVVVGAIGCLRGSDAARKFTRFACV